MIRDLLVEGIEDAGRVLLLSEVVSSVDFLLGRHDGVQFITVLGSLSAIWPIAGRYEGFLVAEPGVEVLSCCPRELGSAVVEWGPLVGALSPP